MNKCKTYKFLINNNLIKNKDGKSLKIFCKLCPDYTAYKNQLPSETVKILWDKYKKSQEVNNNLNGKIFELILIMILVNKKILPLYRETEISFIPGVKYDILLYTNKGFPIVFSAKTSLRERWKQADLEAFAITNVFRNSKSYLLSLDKDEVNRRKSKPEEWLGLADIINCESKEFDNLIDDISNKYTFIKSEPQQIIKSGTIIN